MRQTLGLTSKGAGRSLKPAPEWRQNDGGLNSCFEHFCSSIYAQLKINEGHVFCLRLIANMRAVLLTQYPAPSHHCRLGRLPSSMRGPPPSKQSARNQVNRPPLLSNVSAYSTCLAGSPILNPRFIYFAGWYTFWSFIAHEEKDKQVSVRSFCLKDLMWFTGISSPKIAMHKKQLFKFF